jgi:hypothetical protein
MTQNRRPGFRLPWTSDEEASADAGTPLNADSPTAATAAEASAVDPTSEAGANGTTPTPPAQDGAPSGANSGTEPETTAEAAATAAPEGVADASGPSAPEPSAGDAAAPAAAGPPPEGSTEAPASATPDAASETDFMRDLVAAMRGVADEARRSTSAEVQSRANEQVQQLEADSQFRRGELQSKADADVAGVGEWATAEAERIRVEADQRVAARRAQLEEELAAESHRGEAETRAVRDRLAEYERELDAYHAQLSEITDPAAFAAAAKRMPPPPSFTAEAAAAAAAAAATSPAPEVAPEAAAEPEVAPEAAAEPQVARQTAAEPAAIPAAMAELLPPPDDQNGSEPAEDPAASEHGTLAQRLAHLRAEAAAEGSDAAGPATAAEESATTEVVVRGLGSFGAITGFRQALSGVDGIDGVSLSLGQSGEFVFRATHAPGFDVGGAIVGLEGESAQVEPTPAGGLHVTLERAR